MTHPTLTRLVAFDLETTGVDPFTDRPVSFGFVERCGDTNFSESGGLVNPGLTIPTGASSIHGITDAMVRDALGLGDALTIIVDTLDETWSSGGAIVGMNVSYDLTMVNSLCVALGRGPLDIGAVFDVLIVDRHFDKWRRGSRRLSDLWREYAVTLDHAHAALGDARATLLIQESQFRRYPTLVTMDPSTFTQTFSLWYGEWLSSFSTYVEQKGEPPIARGRYAWPVHEVESSSTW